MSEKFRDRTGKASSSKDPQTEIKQKSSSSQQDPQAEVKLVCDICGHRAKIPSRLKEHMWCHTRPFKCPEPGCKHTTSRPLLLKQHILTHNPDPLARQPYVCPYPDCDYRTAQNSLLILHRERVHEKSGLSKLKCPDCTRHFRFKASLESHSKVHQYKYIKRLKCPHCDYRSNRSQHFQQHVVKHSEERPYACPFCPHRSKWEQNTKKHIKMFHSGIPRVKKPRKPRPKRDPATIQPWRCSYAGCTFQTRHSRRDLLAHEQTHNVDRQRNWECGFCHNRFYRKCHVTRHAQICPKNPNGAVLRKRHKCPKCNYSSRDSWFVKYHMVVHAKEKPFKCPVQGCKYRSKWAKSLPYHMSVHSQTQPYACSFPGCSFRSKWAKNIPVHENRVHRSLDQTGIRKFSHDAAAEGEGGDDELYECLESSTTTGNEVPHSGDSEYNSDQDEYIPNGEMANEVVGGKIDSTAEPEELEGEVYEFNGGQEQQLPQDNLTLVTDPPIVLNRDKFTSKTADCTEDSLPSEVTTNDKSPQDHNGKVDREIESTSALFTCKFCDFKARSQRLFLRHSVTHGKSNAKTVRS